VVAGLLLLRVLRAFGGNLRRLAIEGDPITASGVSE
jgi:hypothetical protein